MISNASASKDDDSKCSPEVDQNKVEKELFNSELEKNAYEMGKDALEEFERSMELEKVTWELTNTSFLSMTNFRRRQVLLKKSYLNYLTN